MTVLKISKLQGFVWKTMQAGDWMAKAVYLLQMLPTFGSRCNRYVWDIRLKIPRLANFNMLFQLVWTKFFKSELFSCLPPVGHVIKSCKEPILLFSLLHLLIFFSIFFHPQIHRPYINPTSTLDSTFFFQHSFENSETIYNHHQHISFVSLHHHHISKCFPPPPHLHYFPSTTTTTFLLFPSTTSTITFLLFL